MTRDKAALAMFAVLLLSYVVNAMDRQLFSVLAPEVRAALALSVPQVGLTALLAIGTTYFLRHRALAASALNFTFSIGAIAGPNLGTAILASTHWQMPFIVFGLLGIVVLALILLFVRPWFTEVEAAGQAAETGGEERLAASIWARTPLTLAAATVFAGLAIYGYLGLYPTYLREALGFTPKETGLVVSFYGLGALLSLFGGWLGDRYDYHRLLFVSLALSAGVGARLWFLPKYSSDLNPIERAFSNFK